MISINNFSLILMFISFALAKDVYLNATNINMEAAVGTAGTVTLAPSYSVQPSLTTMTYSDETTTIFITSTVYNTFWHTPAKTASVDDDESAVGITVASNHADSDISTTSTVTSTLRVTITTDISVANLYSNSTTAISSVAECVPLTQYITITAQPLTQFVTVTADQATQYVTLTVNGTANGTATN